MLISKYSVVYIFILKLIGMIRYINILIFMAALSSDSFLTFPVR